MQLDKNVGSSVVPVKTKVLQYFYLNHPCHVESKAKAKDYGRVASTEVNTKMFVFLLWQQPCYYPYFSYIHFQELMVQKLHNSRNTSFISK